MRLPAGVVLPDGVWATKPLNSGSLNRIRIVNKKVQPPMGCPQISSQAEWFERNALPPETVVDVTNGYMVLEYGSLVSTSKYYVIIDIKAEPAQIVASDLLAKYAIKRIVELQGARRAE